MLCTMLLPLQEPDPCSLVALRPTIVLMLGNTELQAGDHMHAAFFHPFEWYSYSSLPHLRVFPILLRSGTLVLVPHEL